MGALAIQRSIARNERESFNRLSCARRAALLILANACANVANAAGFYEVSAVNSTPISSFVNEGKAKNLGVFSSSSTVISSTAATSIDSSDSAIFNAKRQPLCRDLAASEFHFTSPRFVLPEVRGLSAKSLNVRRDSVSVTYTFR